MTKHYLGALLFITFISTIGHGQTPPSVVASPADLTVPPGFKTSVFASDLAGARLMAVSPEGVLLVARRPRNEVVALPDRNKDGRAEPEVILNNLPNAHSLAFKDGFLYIATTPAVMRVKWVNGKPSGDPEKFADLPSSTPSVHVSRTINVGPDGRLYVAIGSSCNVCVESDPRRTTIQVMNADGSLQPYARGLHNAIGFDWDPQTRRMWADDTGQDNLGDDYPARRNQSDRSRETLRLSVLRREESAECLAARTEGRAARHDRRYRGAARARSPASHHGDGLAVLQGRAVSGVLPERAVSRAARVVAQEQRLQGRARHHEGRTPVRDSRISSVGFLKDGVVMGRPAGLATGADGALYVSDDNKGFIYRVAYGDK